MTYAQSHDFLRHQWWRWEPVVPEFVELLAAISLYATSALMDMWLGVVHCAGGYDPAFWPQALSSSFKDS
jgi:hypothetical protein